MPAGNSFEESHTSFDLTLEGVSYSSVINYAYFGDLSGDVLTIDTTAGNYTYKFSGAFQTPDFSLSSDGGSRLVFQVTPTAIISGTITDQQITNIRTAHPFANIVISDQASAKYNDNVTVSFSGGVARGPKCRHVGQGSRHGGVLDHLAFQQRLQPSLDPVLIAIVASLRLNQHVESVRARDPLAHPTRLFGRDGPVVRPRHLEGRHERTQGSMRTGKSHTGPASFSCGESRLLFVLLTLHGVGAFGDSQERNLAALRRVVETVPCRAHNILHVTYAGPSTELRRFVDTNV